MREGTNFTADGCTAGIIQLLKLPLIKQAIMLAAGHARVMVIWRAMSPVSNFAFNNVPAGNPGGIWQYERDIIVNGLVVL